MQITDPNPTELSVDDIIYIDTSVDKLRARYAFLHTGPSLHSLVVTMPFERGRAYTAMRRLRT